jgi:hypothetical protein
MTILAKTTLMIASVALAICGPVWAAAPLSVACKAELQSLCPKTGDPAARHACMKEKKLQISSGCKAEMRARAQARKAAKANAAAPADMPPADGSR